MYNNNISCGIYSFPKSGNTWVRSIISNLLLNGEYNAIPDIHQSFDASNIKYYEYMDKSYMFFKSHTNYEIDHKKIFNTADHIPIYIMRHPLDVFLSQLNFMLKVEKKNEFQLDYHGVEHIYKNGAMRVYLDAFILYGTLNYNFKECSSWFKNVSYWTERSKESSDVFLIKYEDMKLNLETALEPLLDNFGKTKSNLRESVPSIEEKTKQDGRFFWKKTNANYVNFLSPNDVLWFYKNHGSFCNEVGYTLEDTLNMYSM